MKNMLKTINQSTIDLLNIDPMKSLTSPKSLPKRRKNNYKQGIFIPQNIQKYKGKQPIVYRSGYELKFYKYCDKHPSILEWAVESLKIAYINPMKNNGLGGPAFYYPDILIKYKNTKGEIVIELIEIKPFRETKMPVSKQGKTKESLQKEMNLWLINQAKWDAAIKYCNTKGYIFRLLTEKELNINYSKPKKRIKRT